MVLGGVVRDNMAQGRGNGGQQERVATVRGRVLNRVTNEPIGRALVTTVGDEYAAITDDRGLFEMKIAEQRQEAANVAGSRPAGDDIGVISQFETARAFQAKRPGFLENRQPAIGDADQKSKEIEVTIYLVPEALIVGRVAVPGSEGDVRIRCELYRHQTIEGRERWQPAGNFTTWGSGEFRFSGLEAGTYRLITHEEMDRDSVAPGPGAQLFGYPPIYYPNTTDFSLASPIVVKAGETAQANVTVARRQYYRVRIPVRNTPLAGANVTVYPTEHWGPGWSLGYNPVQRVIEGMLPDGDYTVELEIFGETTSTGVAHFLVKGEALEGAPLYSVPDSSVTVNVRTEFQSVRNGESQESAETFSRERLVNLVVTLRPLEEFGSTGRESSARPVEGTENRTLTILNVRPGRYHVVAQATNGYVASIRSGGVDLLNQPLVVGPGGGVPPIEITLRDDGAEVSGTVEGAAGVKEHWQQGRTNIPKYWRVFLLPIGRMIWQEPPWYRTWDGTFRLSNVPPGEYLVVAYEEYQKDLNLPLGDEEFVRGLEGKGQRIHVETGEKVANVKVRALAGSDRE